MAEDKPKHLSELAVDPQLYVYDFLADRDLAVMARISKNTKIFSEQQEHPLWKNRIKETKEILPNSQEEETPSPKNIAEDYPERRKADYLTIKGRKGADLCRAVLRKNPGDIDATSRLAFLIGIGEASKIPEDSNIFNHPPSVVWNIWQQNSNHVENEYHLGKLSSPASAINHYCNVLITNPNHTGALYEAIRCTQIRSAIPAEALLPLAGTPTRAGTSTMGWPQRGRTRRGSKVSAGINYVLKILKK